MRPSMLRPSVRSPSKFPGMRASVLPRMLASVRPSMLGPSSCAPAR